MKKKPGISKKNLVFSQWSRKNYAVFASLGKVVTIAHVSVDICNCSLKKNFANSEIIRLANNFGNSFKDIINELDDHLCINAKLGLIFNFLIHSLKVVSTESLQSEIETVNQHKLSKVHILKQLKYGLFI